VFGVLHPLADRVGHGGDESGDDQQLVIAELVEDGVGAIAERPEEGQV